MANTAFQQPSTPQPLPVANGGTGASTAADARANLGLVTTAALARAYYSGSATLTAGQLTKIVFDQESWDVGGHFATGTFTAPRAGKYLIKATVGLVNKSGGATSPRMMIQVYKNGQASERLCDVWMYNTANDNGYGITGYTEMLLAANDTIDIYVFTSASSQQLDGDTNRTWVVIREMPEYLHA